MTGRGVLDRRVRWVVGSAYAGLALCVVGVIGYELTGRGEWFVLWLPGFPVAFAAWTYAYLVGLWRG